MKGSSGNSLTGGTMTPEQLKARSVVADDFIPKGQGGMADGMVPNNPYTQQNAGSPPIAGLRQPNLGPMANPGQTAGQPSNVMDTLGAMNQGAGRFQGIQGLLGQQQPIQQPYVPARNLDATIRQPTGIEMQRAQAMNMRRGQPGWIQQQYQNRAQPQEETNIPNMYRRFRGGW